MDIGLILDPAFIGAVATFSGALGAAGYKIGQAIAAKRQAELEEQKLTSEAEQRLRDEIWTELHRLRDEVRQLQQSVAEWQGRYFTLLGEHNQLKGAHELLAGQYNTLKDDHAALKQQHRAILEELTQLRARIAIEEVESRHT